VDVATGLAVAAVVKLAAVAGGSGTRPVVCAAVGADAHHVSINPAGEIAAVGSTEQAQSKTSAMMAPSRISVDSNNTA